MSEKHYTLQQLGWKAFFNQQLSLDDLDGSAPFRVNQVFRNRLLVTGEQGELNIDLAQHTHLHDATIGDWLLISNTTPQSIRILDRLSEFKRKSPGANLVQLIAANVDTAFIVSSFNHDFNLSRIERYLALAKDAQADVVLLLTKADTVTDEQQQEYLSQVVSLAPYLPVVALNALNQTTCEQLVDWCKAGQTIVLLGSSGVGKTTLTNTLCATDEKTADIRTDDSKGRHTTTGRSLHFTQSGGLVLDCPGMRELQLTDCEDGVKEVFADIEALARQCRFSDCLHQTEPNCSILAALAAQTLDQRRLDNYQKMLKEQARNSMTLAESHKKDREFGKLIKSSLQGKKSRFEQ